MTAGRPPILQTRYPNRIREFREARGWTLYKTGQLAGWTTSTQKRYETGEHQIPVPKLERLAKVFGVPARDLLNDNYTGQDKQRVLLEIEMFDIVRRLDDADLERFVKMGRGLMSDGVRLRVV